MPEPVNIQPWMNEFLARNLLARMATADPDTAQPHVVPVWFGWDGAVLWIHSYRTTRKIRELQRNPLISVVVDVPGGEEESKAVVFEGRAELVSGPRDWLEKQIAWIYEKYLGPEGVLEPDPQEWIHSPDGLLIKLAPEKVYSWKG